MPEGDRGHSKVTRRSPKVPEGPRRYPKVPEGDRGHSKVIRRCPKVTEVTRRSPKVPEGTRRYPKVPEGHSKVPEGHSKVPEGTRRYPKASLVTTQPLENLSSRMYPGYPAYRETPCLARYPAHQLKSRGTTRCPRQTCPTSGTWV